MTNSFAFVRDKAGSEDSRVSRSGQVQSGDPLVGAVRALSTCAGNAATVRTLTRWRLLAREPATKYSDKTLAELKSLAKTDPDAVWELQARYQNMTTEELRLAARSDALARQVAAERRALLVTAVPGDPRWEGHQLPHEATAVSSDAQENVVWRGRAISGKMTDAEKAMPFPRGMNLSHTEVRLLLAGELPRGGTFRITGQFDPCSSCQTAMRAAADRSGCTIEYWWPGAPNGRPFVAQPPLAPPSGTPPPAVPPTAPPQETAPGVEGAAPAVEGVAPGGSVTAPASESVAPSAEVSEGAVVATPEMLSRSLSLAGGVLATVALWWLNSKLGEIEQARVDAAFAAKVTPEVTTAMLKLHTAAEKMTADDPSRPVYATVVVDVTHAGWTGEGGMSEAFQDVKFVGPVTISRDKVASEHTIEDHSDCTQGGGYGCAKWGVRRVTYSVEIKFDETDDQHYWRVMAAQVVGEIKAGRPARRFAELGELGGWQPMSERERVERHDPHGPNSRALKEQQDFKIRWTKLYITATAGRPQLTRLHDDAQRYLDELQGRAVAPEPQPIIAPLGDDAATHELLKQWMQTK